MKKQEKYIPATRLSSPKSTPGGEFVIMSSKEPYRGPYVETFKGTYFAGNSLSTGGPELERIATSGNQNLEDALIGVGSLVSTSLLTSLLQKFFKKKPSQQDLEKGVTKRYLIQDKKNNKIVETDKETYLQAQQELVNRTFVELDWIVKGPAEDQMIGGYFFKGAATRNEQTIKQLEKTIPGVSTYITNYGDMVVEPTGTEVLQQETQTIAVEDSTTALINSRKARFDKKK